MRRLVTWSAAWLCLAMLAWTTRPVVWASPIESDPPATTPKMLENGDLMSIAAG